MTPTMNRAKLKAALDYLIFSRTRVTIILPDAPFGRFIGTIVARPEGNCLDIQIHDAAMYGSDIRHTPTTSLAGTLSAPYLEKRLEVSVTLVNTNPETNVFRFGVLGTALLIDQRIWPRTAAIPAVDHVRCELLVRAAAGIMRITATSLIDFAYDSISVSIKRSSGLLAPGDHIQSLTATLAGHTLLQTDGVIKKIDRLPMDKALPDAYIAVIRLNGPHSQPTLPNSESRRQSDRATMLNDKNAFLEFSHPLISELRVAAPICDVATSGLAIIVDNRKHALPRGLLISNATLQLPMRPRLKVELRVTDYQLLTENSRIVCRVGLAFVRPSIDVVNEISIFVQKSICAYLTEADGNDHELLWAFFFETGFIYDSKRRQLQPHAEKILETNKRLLESKTPLCKRILYKENGEIKGHVTAVKFFDQSLLIQHLGALSTSTGSAAREVLRGITSYFMDQNTHYLIGNRYVHAYYRPDNVYPSLLFGESARIISTQFTNDPSACWTRLYNFCLPTASASSKPPDNVACREATEDDLNALECLLCAQGESLLMRLEGLTRSTMVSLVVSEQYSRIGLYRHRRVFVAQDRITGHTGYAVCNYSSPGINLSEITNSVKFYYSFPGLPGNAYLANALSSPIKESYRNTDMPDTILLLQPNQPVPQGFTLEKTYTLWALDLAQVKYFRMATEQIFASLKMYLRDRMMADSSCLPKQPISTT